MCGFLTFTFFITILQILNGDRTILGECEGQFFNCECGIFLLTSLN